MPTSVTGLGKSIDDEAELRYMAAENGNHMAKEPGRKGWKWKLLAALLVVGFGALASFIARIEPLVQTQSVVLNAAPPVAAPMPGMNPVLTPLPGMNPAPPPGGMAPPSGMAPPPASIPAPVPAQP
jgi:hypothetical protein